MHQRSHPPHIEKEKGENDHGLPQKMRLEKAPEAPYLPKERHCIP